MSEENQQPLSTTDMGNLMMAAHIMTLKYGLGVDVNDKLQVIPTHAWGDFENSVVLLVAIEKAFGEVEIPIKELVTFLHKNKKPEILSNVGGHPQRNAAIEDLIVQLQAAMGLSVTNKKKEKGVILH